MNHDSWALKETDFGKNERMDQFDLTESLSLGQDLPFDFKKFKKSNSKSNSLNLESAYKALNIRWFNILSN